MVNRKLMGYVLQDLQCEKCQQVFIIIDGFCEFYFVYDEHVFGQVKDDNMKLRCTCAGAYKTIIDTQQTVARMKTFKEIAQHFGMPLLHLNVDWILKMSPALKASAENF